MGVFAAITDPRPGYDCGKKKSFNFDYSYNTMTEVRLGCEPVIHFRPLIFTSTPVLYYTPPIICTLPFVSWFIAFIFPPMPMRDLV